MIKTIFFDIGNVLINIHPHRTFEYISKRTGVEIQILKESFPENIHDEYEKGEISNIEWFLKYKNSLPELLDLTEEDFWKAWKLLLGKEKKTTDLVKLLKPNYSVWLLSNTNPKHIQDEIEKKYEFPSLIDGAVYSFEVGKRKPSYDIYQIATEMAGVKNHEALFIDDLPENIIAAKEIGITSFLFTTYEQLKIDLKSLRLRSL